MPTSFAITAASNSVYLDEDRRGEVSFTVTNQSGRSIRGRAHVVADDAVAKEWITVRGQAEREFATAGTERYAVDIDVPPDAPSGSYTARLDMIGVDRPDEHYVEGPAVTFQVPDSEPQRKSFPTWIPLVAASVILLGALLIFWCQIFGCETGENATDTVTDAATVLIQPDGNQMAYAQTEFTVEPGQEVLLVLENIATAPAMQHNLVILDGTEPEMIDRVGQGALAAGAEQEYIPEDDAIIAYTPLAEPGETVEVALTAPEEEGDYQFICTFPGHYQLMQGTMHVRR